MLLEELLFCTVFLGLPIVGMITMLIARVLKEGAKSIGEASNRAEITFRKSVRQLPIPAFANKKVMEYQLIESQVHMPIQFNRIKERTHPRAGPIIHRTNGGSLWNDS